MKTGRLSKVELQYITDNLDKSNEELSFDLDRSEKLVAETRKIVEKALKKKNPKKQEEATTQKRTETPFVKSLGRKERNGKYVATILTQAASQIADDLKKINKGKDLNCLHKPRGD